MLPTPLFREAYGNGMNCSKRILKIVYYDSEMNSHVIKYFAAIQYSDTLELPRTSFAFVVSH